MKNYFTPVLAILVLLTGAGTLLCAQSSDSRPSADAPSPGTVTHLIGVAAQGGTAGVGTIYKINADGGDVEVLFNFDKWNGALPNGSLVQATNGSLYGVASQGGLFGDNGTLFKINPDGSGFRVMVNFDGVNGQNPYGALIQGSDGWLYGLTEGGGSGGVGTVFKINMDGSDLRVLHNFTLGDGGWARSTLMQASNGSLYGITIRDGGTIFRINTDGSGYEVLRRDAGLSYGTLTELADGSFVGMAQVGGGMDEGTTGTAIMFAINADGSDYSILYKFHEPTLWFPMGTLLLAPDGFLYGTTYYGGRDWSGTIFKIKPNGTGYTELHNFNGADGALPIGGSLTHFKNKLYGTTTWGGQFGNGVIFNFDLATSTYTKMADFNEETGKYPMLGSLSLLTPTSPPDEETDFSVVDARTGEIFMDFDDSVTLDVNHPGFRYMTIRANAASEKTGSVVFRVGEEKANVENKTPYLLQGRFVRSLSAGPHLLVADVYSRRSGKGVQQQHKEAVITIVNNAEVAGLDVFSISGGWAQLLQDGSVLNVKDPRFHNMNIYTFFTQDPNAGSVQFYLNEAPYHVENEPPYIMVTGNRKWWGAPGLYTVRATPFSKRNGKGVPGKGVMVSFYIIERNINTESIAARSQPETPQMTTETEGSFSIYPVPAQGTLHVLMSDRPQDPLSQVIIGNIHGHVLFNGFVPFTHDSFTLDLDELGLVKGIYYLRLRTSSIDKTLKFIRE